MSLSTEQISLLVTVVVALGTALAGYLKSKSLATRAEKAATTAEGHALSAKESAESVE